jgi:hypothetical protein
MCPVMTGQGDPGRSARRAGGPIARRVWGPDAPLRRAVGWLFADREEIDQEGLLAERTLLRTPRRAGTRGDDGAEPHSSRPPAGELRR